MTPCPRCGTQNAESARACSLCGSKLTEGNPEAGPKPVEGEPASEAEAKPATTPEAAAVPEPAVPEPAAPEPAAPEPAAAPGRRHDFARTLVGQGLIAPTVTALIAPNQAAAPPEPGVAPPVPVTPPARAPAGIGRGTIMGMGIPIPSAAPPAPAPIPDEPATLPHPALQGAAALGHRTVLGLAPPPVVEPGGLGGTVVMKPAQRTLVGTPPTPVPPDGNAKPPTKTILGVARPGIAPMNPGMAKAAATLGAETFPSPPPPPPLLEPYNEPSEPNEPNEPISAGVPRRTLIIAMLVIVAAFVMLAGAGAALYFLRGPGTIEAKPGLDPDGQERLDLTCAGCKDGTTVTLGSQQATVSAGRARLTMPSGLQVGENRFELTLRAPGSSRASRVSLTVPLEFRVRADTSPLADTSPHLAIAIEAVPGSTVLVDGKPVPLPANGRTRYDLDVTSEISGIDTVVRRLERKASYSITPPGRPAETGEVTFQVGIVPLSIDAPGESITIETSTFVLAGRTQKGASVTVSGRPLVVDADGRFEQTMSVSSPGETVVTARASISDSAPRLYSFKVRRVTSLRDEARTRRSGAATSYATLVADSDKKQNTAVAVDGNVIELNNAGHSALLLVDTKVGCAKGPCITRVLHGARLDVALGDSVSVFGRLRGSVEGARQGTRVPEVFADFVLKGRR